jgi:hypothetical protein
VDRADLIINVGHDDIEKPPFFMTAKRPRVIHVNFFPAQVDEIYFPQHEVVGDIAHAMWLLSERIQPQAHWDFSYSMRVKTYADQKIAERADEDSFPVFPQRVVADVRKALRTDDILALDNGTYKIWFARNYPALAPNTVLLDNALATMGAGLPSAIAAKLVFPDRKVVAICGDGGFMMNSQELETAVRLKLDLVVVVLNDGCYGMIKWKQQSMGFAECGVDYSNPDFVQYANAYGAQGHRVTRADELLPLLRTRTRVSSRGPSHRRALDYSENRGSSAQELATKVCICSAACRADTAQGGAGRGQKFAFSLMPSDRRRPPWHRGTRRRCCRRTRAAISNSTSRGLCDSWQHLLDGCQATPAARPGRLITSRCAESARSADEMAQMCRSCTPCTSGTAAMARSTSANSTLSGVPSMSTFTVDRMMRTAWWLIHTDTRMDTRGSA